MLCLELTDYTMGSLKGKVWSGQMNALKQCHLASFSLSNEISKDQHTLKTSHSPKTHEHPTKVQNKFNKLFA